MSRARVLYVVASALCLIACFVSALVPSAGQWLTVALFGASALLFAVLASERDAGPRTKQDGHERRPRM